jgi:hypothetical protein
MRNTLSQGVASLLLAAVIGFGHHLGMPPEVPRADAEGHPADCKVCRLPLYGAEGQPSLSGHHPGSEGRVAPAAFHDKMPGSRASSPAHRHSQSAIVPTSREADPRRESPAR